MFLTSYILIPNETVNREVYVRAKFLTSYILIPNETQIYNTL